MHCWARYLFVAVVIGLGSLSMIGACGHKGPLTLPPPAGEAPAKGAKPAADVPQVPQVPRAAQTPASDPGLLAWPAGGAGTCTGGCSGGTGAAQ